MGPPPSLIFRRAALGEYHPAQPHPAVLPGPIKELITIPSFINGFVHICCLLITWGQTDYIFCHKHFLRSSFPLHPALLVLIEMLIGSYLDVCNSSLIRLAASNLIPFKPSPHIGQSQLIKTQPGPNGSVAV